MPMAPAADADDMFLLPGDRIASLHLRSNTAAASGPPPFLLPPRAYGTGM